MKIKIIKVLLLLPLMLACLIFDSKMFSSMSITAVFAEGNTEVNVYKELLEEKLWASDGAFLRVNPGTEQNIEIHSRFTTYSNLEELEEGDLDYLINYKFLLVEGFEDNIDSVRQNAQFSSYFNILNVDIINNKVDDLARNLTHSLSSKVIRMELSYVKKIDDFYIYYGSPKSLGYSVNETNEDYIFFFKHEGSIYSIAAASEEYYSDESDKRYILMTKYIPLDDETLVPLKESLSYDFEQLITANDGDPIEYLSSVESETLLDEFDYDSYSPIDYSEIIRYRDGKKGYKDTFFAEVQQYQEDGDRAFALLKKSEDINKLYYAEFNRLPELRLVEGDIVEVYGTLDSLYTYETVIGGTNTVPKIIVDKILIEGIDY